MVLGVEVAGFDVERFLRAAAGLPGGHDQIGQARVADELEEPLDLLGREGDLAMIGRRHFEVGQRADLKEPLADGPIAAAFDRPHVVASGGDGEVVVVDPGFDVMGADLACRDPRVLLDEPFEAIAVPLVGIGSPFPLDPFEEPVGQVGECEHLDLHPRVAGLLRHHRVELVEGLFLVGPRLCRTPSMVTNQQLRSLRNQGVGRRAMGTNLSCLGERTTRAS